MPRFNPETLIFFAGTGSAYLQADVLRSVLDNCTSSQIAKRVHQLLSSYDVLPFNETYAERAMLQTKRRPRAGAAAL